MNPLELSKRPDKERAWPESGLEHLRSCPVCESSDRTLLYQGLRDVTTGAAPGEWTLYRCSRCASVWLDPRPTPLTIGRAYSNYLTHHDAPDTKDTSASPLTRLIRGLLNDYRACEYGDLRSPVVPGGRWLIHLVPPVRASIDARYRHLSRAVSGGQRLLDYGCANGGFLKTARSLGWTVKGVDFDPVAVQLAREQGLDVDLIDGTQAIDGEDQYDAITLSHVIEHVHDPSALLRQLYRLLKPGGRLWLETPNVCSSAHRRYGRHWYNLDPPRHLVLFSPDTLRDVLSRAGFDDFETYWHGLVAIEMGAASDALRRQGQARRLLDGLGFRLLQLAAELGDWMSPASRELITMTARKPPKP